MDRPEHTDPPEVLLRRHFGYPAFRPLQSRVLAAVAEGRDVLAVLPTGGGKSVCFQIPALMRTGPTVVLSPLISLMQDQVSQARARGLPAAAVNSALSDREQRDVLGQIVCGEVRLVYTSPERLARLAGDLDRLAVRPSLLAVDEAHCISEWGPEFRPAYRGLRRLRRALGWPQVIALTGSATPAVRLDITRSLGLGGRSLGKESRESRLVLGSFNRPNLWFGVARIASERERLAALLAVLRLKDGLAIVYAPTRGSVEELARVLFEAGFRSAPYHAGLGPAVRKDVLRRFLEGDLQVVVATCAFGMGIDKPDVRVVVHWTLPSTPESYYQEAGRAGRDGRFARCVLLYREGDGEFLRRTVNTTDHTRRREVLGRIEVMERYACERSCRRRALLRYFGERLPRCAGCDICGRGGPRPLSSAISDRRLVRLRAALGTRGTPWGGCVLEPEVLRRLADSPPTDERALAAVEGVGPVLAGHYSKTIFEALAP